MRTLSTTRETRDLVLDGAGNLSLDSNRAAVMNICERAAMTRLGEMVLFTDRGLPFFEAVWASPPLLAIYEAILRASLLQRTGVIGIRSLVLQRDGDRLRYTAEIVTIYGTGTING